MKREDHIDFHLVQDHHLAIHERLEAWARWVRVRPCGWQVQPMFRQYRPPQEWHHRREPSLPVNIPEALEVERAVSLLPEKHRFAIRWCYVFGTQPGAAARHAAVNKRQLMELVQVGRTMLRNTL
jgi:DNA-directed RNA polymerase specialized sigma24 family protein